MLLTLVHHRKGAHQVLVMKDCTVRISIPQIHPCKRFLRLTAPGILVPNRNGIPAPLKNMHRGISLSRTVQRLRKREGLKITLLFKQVPKQRQRFIRRRRLRLEEITDPVQQHRQVVRRIPGIRRNGTVQGVIPFLVAGLPCSACRKKGGTASGQEMRYRGMLEPKVLELIDGLQQCPVSGLFRHCPGLLIITAGRDIIIPVQRFHALVQKDCHFLSHVRRRPVCMATRQ